MLDELALNYGCSIVRCPAMQPAFDERKLRDGLPLEGRDRRPIRKACRPRCGAPKSSRQKK